MNENFVNALAMEQVIFSVALLSVAGFFFVRALQQCRQGCFYRDVPPGFLLGIFVWGDALVLGPFWMLSSILFLFLPPLMILRYFLIFFSLRAAYEVIYWLNHQSVKDSYQPPLFRRISWIKSNEAAILYQLLNFCQIVLFSSLLLWSF